MGGVALGVGEGLAPAFPPDEFEGAFTFAGNPPAPVLEIPGWAAFAPAAVEGSGVSELACDCKDE